MQKAKGQNITDYKVLIELENDNFDFYSLFMANIFFNLTIKWHLYFGIKLFVCAPNTVILLYKNKKSQ